MTTILLMTTVLATGMAQADDPQAFAQGVDYRIEATLDEATDVLHGRARLRYTNNSPDRLDRLYFHQHLNAFRPNSAWARRELEFGERRFQDLGPDEHAYERLTAVEVDGRAVQPVYPGAPDSTVVMIELPEPLEPGETATVLLDWDARLATEPRRQARRGRHYDFAQWYPRIAVYEPSGWQYQPLLPQGEFYGEFASWDVTLDVAEDQVIGATGVPVEGDPGWEGAAAEGFDVPGYTRGAFGLDAEEPIGLLPAEAEPGRRRVRWRADRVHHFAWSTSPDYIYEGGQSNQILIHVLYQPGDDDWANGVAVERTAEALAWMDEVFGEYPYPQVTNVHRIESGGTEFPMLIMDGSASLGLIVHEIAHQYAHGLLANNEWRDAWLDEGMASFVTNWHAEAWGGGADWRAAIAAAAERERAGATQPIALPSADFDDYSTYGAMSYTKASLVLRMLRWYLGEPVFREGLRRYYEENRFQHVTEDHLRAAFEEVGGEDLEWFFRQWLHTTETLDYAVTDARTERLDAGGWRTTVEVVREGGIWMPVTLRVGDADRRLESRERRQTVTIETAERPDRVVLDPEEMLLDLDRANNAARPVEG